MKNISILLVLAALACSAGCKTTTSPTASGSFAGRVLLFDSTGTALPNFSGTTVVLDGTTFSTTTDATGQWQISGVPEGQYNVTASKPGFGTFHWYEQQIIDGRLDLGAAVIVNMPIDKPVLMNASAILGGTLSANGQTAGPMQTLVIDCDLDSTTLPSEPHLATGLGYISINNLRAAGAVSGKTLYISISAVYNGTYYQDEFVTYFFDPTHNEFRWASTGPKSNVIAVTMP